MTVGCGAGKVVQEAEIEVLYLHQGKDCSSSAESDALAYPSNERKRYESQQRTKGL
jgi:hypothetical protein